jgi:hypothetical protein
MIECRGLNVVYGCNKLEIYTYIETHTHTDTHSHMRTVPDWVQYTALICWNCNELKSKLQRYLLTKRNYEPDNFVNSLEIIRPVD